jgi:signal transduction histidine kinase
MTAQNPETLPAPALAAGPERQDPARKRQAASRPVRSTPLRLTVILIVVFTLASLIGFAAAFLVSRYEADRALHVQVSQEFTGYRLERSQAGLQDRIFAQASVIPRGSLILIYRSDSGQRIANVPRFPQVGEYGILSHEEIDPKDPQLAESYLVVSGRVGQGVLTMARSREQVSELGALFTTIFLLSLLPTLAIAVATGSIIARRARGRVEQIRTTLETLASGNLQARVPDFQGAPDDLSLIGGAVNRMASAQAASVASLRQVSSDIAHDLKTPIQRVSVLLERLDATGPLSDAQADLVAQARAQSTQIVKTFQSLLQIAQMEGGALQSHFTKLDLARVISGITEIYGPNAEETGHDLRCKTEGAGPFWVRGERNLLGQLAANLIENALRHTPAGASITLSLHEKAGAVTLTVADTGPGIPEAERENVLRRLYRLERSRTSEGSGLGLSLVAAIADVHGAKLVLGDNAPGLRVSLHFPPAQAG